MTLADSSVQLPTSAVDFSQAWEHTSQHARTPPPARQICNQNHSPERRDWPSSVTSSCPVRKLTASLCITRAGPSMVQTAQKKQSLNLVQIQKLFYNSHKGRHEWSNTAWEAGIYYTRAGILGIWRHETNWRICFLRLVYHQLWMSYEADDWLGFYLGGAILLLNYKYLQHQGLKFIAWEWNLKPKTILTMFILKSILFELSYFIFLSDFISQPSL